MYVLIIWPLLYFIPWRLKTFWVQQRENLRRKGMGVATVEFLLYIHTCYLLHNVEFCSVAKKKMKRDLRIYLFYQNVIKFAVCLLKRKYVHVKMFIKHKNYILQQYIARKNCLKDFPFDLYKILFNLTRKLLTQ